MRLTNTDMEFKKQKRIDFEVGIAINTISILLGRVQDVAMHFGTDSAKVMQAGVLTATRISTVINSLIPAPELDLLGLDDEQLDESKEFEIKARHLIAVTRMYYNNNVRKTVLVKYLDNDLNFNSELYQVEVIEPKYTVVLNDKQAKLYNEIKAVFDEYHALRNKLEKVENVLRVDTITGQLITAVRTNYLDEYVTAQRITEKI